MQATVTQPIGQAPGLARLRKARYDDAILGRNGLIFPGKHNPFTLHHEQTFA